MKINSISNNNTDYGRLSFGRYNGKGLQQRINNRYVSKPVAKLSELRDSSDLGLKEKLFRMLDFSDNNSCKRLVLGKDFFGRLKNFFDTGLTQHKLDEYLKIYTLQGKKDFWNANYKTFEEVINNPDSMNYEGYIAFRTERDKLMGLEITDEEKNTQNLSPEIRAMLQSCGYHNGALDIIRKSSVFFRNIINETQTNVDKPAVISTGIYGYINKAESQKTTSEADRLLSEYRELVKNQGEFPSGGTEAEKAAWHETDNRRRELLNKICDKDISIIEKQEFSTDPLVDADKKNLYLSSLTWRSSFNMATQSDIIGEYEKYLTRGWLPGETRRSSIFEFSRACWPVDAKCNPTDEYLYSVADRYLSVMERIAERDNAGMRDVVYVNGVMRFYKNIMDERLALKYIELLKRISFQQVDGMQAEQYTSKVESPKVKQAILELKEALKEYPFEDKTRND